MKTFFTLLIIGVLCISFPLTCKSCYLTTKKHVLDPASNTANKVVKKLNKIGSNLVK